MSTVRLWLGSPLLSWTSLFLCQCLLLLIYYEIVRPTTNTFSRQTAVNVGRAPQYYHSIATVLSSFVKCMPQVNPKRPAIVLRHVPLSVRLSLDRFKDPFCSGTFTPRRDLLTKWKEFERLFYSCRFNVSTGGGIDAEQTVDKRRS